MGRFDDRATRPERTPADILRWKLGNAVRGRPAAGDFRLKVRENDGSRIALATPSITWVGHASFLVRLGGKLIAFDPMWSKRAGVVAREVPPGVALEAVLPVDVVLVTHNHYDHLDMPTLQRIGPESLYVVPLGNGDLLRRNGLERVIELDWWQTHTHETVRLTLVPARHWSMRSPFDRNDTLWGGYVVSAEGLSVYHSGDTGMFDDFAEVGRRAGPIHAAMLPIGAYEPRWFMEPQHLHPEEAGEAFQMLGAQHFAAMHWATFRLTDEPLIEPANRIRAFFESRKIDPSRLWLMDVGETRLLRDPPQTNGSRGGSAAE